jgi:hypothetical protein
MPKREGSSIESNWGGANLRDSTGRHEAGAAAVTPNVDGGYDPFAHASANSNPVHAQSR